MVTTTDHKGNKALTGGMMKRQMPQQQITNYINVTSIDEYSSKPEKAGDTIGHPKAAVPTMGYVVCLDTEHNNFAIWETNENAK